MNGQPTEWRKLSMPSYKGSEYPEERQGTQTSQRQAPNNLFQE